MDYSKSKCVSAGKALYLLQCAERELDSQRFWPLYRELARFCMRGEWISCSEYAQKTCPGPDYRYGIAFSPKDGSIVLAVEDKIQILDQDLSLTASLDISLSDIGYAVKNLEFRTLTFSRDGNLLAVEMAVQSKPVIQIWDMERKSFLHMLDDSAGHEIRRE